MKRVNYVVQALVPIALQNVVRQTLDDGVYVVTEHGGVVGPFRSAGALSLLAERPPGPVIEAGDVFRRGLVCLADCAFWGTMGPTTWSGIY